ncbi:carboxypeptidase-like regulatory domain-containing protein [Chitinophaga japonensis]|uniref:carboxypeptidase-like regulatory domain-containing protein n=1 Tax=Chitinophaga japonensis TaxID=104662 RepID=UPI0013152A11|nr:carboxypeptidase-like regulatory domain-containing protein [Chitinophaga japonensis]
MQANCLAIVKKLTCKNKCPLLVILFFMTMAHHVFAQEQRSITGRITDATTQQPVPGVSVSLKGSGIGTASAGDGTFTLKIPAGKDPVLTFSSLGYASREIALTADNQVNVSLQPSSSTLSDVVVWDTAPRNVPALPAR